MYRVFLSHSRRDNAAARAVFRWLTDNEAGLEGDIFLVNPNTGFAPGVRWKSELDLVRSRIARAELCQGAPIAPSEPYPGGGGSSMSTFVPSQWYRTVVRKPSSHAVQLWPHR